MQERIGQTWPAVEWEPRVWEWHGERPAARLDRLFRSYESAVPPVIGVRTVVVDPVTAVLLDETTADIARLDATLGSQLSGVSAALLRSESVGSSRIEHLATDARGLGLAAIGESKPRSIASQVWANVAAMERAIEIGANDGSLDDAVLDIHRVLMGDDPYEASWAGRWRTMQSWIGGSDECPREALFVPPSSDRVADLMADLAVFVARSDVPVFAQAAIAHAQFETIHPFADGNGRTGRALIHALLRRRRLTTSAVVPTSSALLADVDGYFAALDAYRRGDLDEYLQHVAAATRRAVAAAGVLAAELTRLRADWEHRVRPRVGSIVARLLDALTRQPVMSATQHGSPGADAAGLYRAVERLVAAGVLIELTSARRNRIWMASEVTAELDDFARRIGRRRSMQAPS